MRAGSGTGMDVVEDEEGCWVSVVVVVLDVPGTCGRGGGNGWWGVDV